MSLSERFAEASSAEQTTLCKIGAILANESIPSEERKVLSTILDVPEGTPGRLTNAAIGRVLRAEKFDLSNSAVDRHRRNDCPCTRKVSA
jgi:hypothetical protein